MNVIRRIAREEWRSMARDRIAVIGLALVVMLSAVAALTAHQYQERVEQERTQHQQQANDAFGAQPDRHPHRMVHYGHFVFRPLNALAAFDPGIDAYTGNTLFLEGHRQNGANFSDARQSSLLIRFGQLTPAFVLQVLVPLLLIFLGHAAVARERERGTLRLLLTQGVSSGQVVAGKLLALAGIALALLVPPVLALFASGALHDVPATSLAVLASGYVLWMLIAALMVVLVSTLLQRARDALLALLAIWAVSVILVPRVAPDIASAAIALPTRYENMIAVERDLKAVGDSHNPDDPYFAAFKAKVLRQYGVGGVDQLPVNYKGLVALEGERLTSALFKRDATVSFDLQQQQSSFVDGFSIFSPVIALRRLSMGAAGTDLASYRRFLEQGEQHRYRLVQKLNALQAEKVDFALDGKAGEENRISRDNWRDVPAFHYQPTPPGTMLRAVAPAGATLALWLLAVVVMTFFATRRLGRAAR